MSGAKETPRQKMIGMMYLVLTAMLAMNVSVEVLKSFLVVNEAMEETNKNFSSKVSSLYDMFRNAYAGNPEKTKDAWEKAQIVQSKSAELRAYIEEIKVELTAACEKVTIEEARSITPYQLGRQDNYDDPTNYFIGGSEDGSSGKARELNNKITAFRAEMHSILGDGAEKVPMDGLRTDKEYRNANGELTNWELAFFYHTIVVADLSTLNKLIGEVYNAEYETVSQLYSAISENDFKFDNISGRAIAKSNYVLLGDQFEAEIFVAAFDSKSDISATIEGRTYHGENGVVKFKKPANSLGEHKINGMISVPASFGVKEYPFSVQYVVEEPSASISADAMNVMYVGVDNPISAMASGASDSKTRVKMTNGTLTKRGPGKYVARVTQPGTKAVVSVYVVEDNKEQFMGSQTYRVKRVPDPVARINGQQEGTKNIDKNTLANAGGLLVSMKDFEFELTIKVGSFGVQIASGQELSNVMRSNSNRFTQDMVDRIKRCKRGDKVFIQDIVAQMPDGNRTLGDMILTIK